MEDVLEKQQQEAISPKSRRFAVAVVSSIGNQLAAKAKTVETYKADIDAAKSFGEMVGVLAKAFLENPEEAEKDSSELFEALDEYALNATERFSSSLCEKLKAMQALNTVLTGNL